MKSGRRAAAAFLISAIALTLLPFMVACHRDGTIPIPKGKDESLSTEQLFQKGQALLERRRFFRARSIMEKVMGRSDASRQLLADANLAIADAYYHDGGIINLAEALSRYTSFLTFYPTHAKADYAQFQLGLCYLKEALGPDKDQATTRKALKAFRDVERNYPASDWVIPAQEQAEVCRERLAESEMRVGLFYKKRSAYPGAINRFRNILESYPLYSRRDRTFFELARTLKAANKRDEALIYYRKVLEEFPDSRYAPEARDALKGELTLQELTAEAVKREAPGEGG
jgi:outer membrane protein assembly factor BamD